MHGLAEGLGLKLLEIFFIKFFHRRSLKCKNLALLGYSTPIILPTFCFLGHVSFSINVCLALIDSGNLK